MPALALRSWQEEALLRWEGARRHGIVAVVTGAGKTIFALACIARNQADTTLVVVPTVALLDQWWEETASFFGLKLDEVHVITGKQRMRSGTINLAVLNTASKLHEEKRDLPCFLIVDECHKAASPQFKSALDVPAIATLGLSATPERPYDEGLAEILVPALGPIIYEYTYSEALRDGVIVPFLLRNIIFDLEEERQAEYDKLTKAVARAIRKYGPEADETVVLTVTSGTGYNVGSPSSATGTIVNDDTVVTVAVSPLSVAEGGSNLVYTFTRTGVTTSSLTVNFSIGGSASFGSDYTQTGATTFTPPTGSTFPRNVISPVIATSFLTALAESAETIAVASVIPADGPSLGIAPSGMWMCRS